MGCTALAMRARHRRINSQKREAFDRLVGFVGFDYEAANAAFREFHTELHTWYASIHRIGGQS